MNQKVWIPSWQRTASDIPFEDLEAFLDTHGWKNEPKETREKIREYIVHFYSHSMYSRQVPLSEVRKRLKKLKSALTSAADRLFPSDADFIHWEALNAILREDPQFDHAPLTENLRRLANICGDAWLSSKKMAGGSYRDINARRFANNCYHFLRKCHPKPKVTKALLTEVTQALYDLFKFAEEPGLQRAVDDVWKAHKRYEAGQSPYITDDARQWFSAPKARLEPTGGSLMRPLGVRYPDYDW